MTSVLVIDDEAPIRLLCRVNLEAEGMDVLEAADGPTGLEQARDNAPDVVLLDVMMPGLDGWRVAEQLLQDDRTSEIPIMRAAAVEAVRPGLRIEFARASRPALPPIFVAGQPSTDANGRTSQAEISATPMKSRNAPTPMARSRWVTPIPCTNRIGVRDASHSSTMERSAVPASLDRDLDASVPAPALDGRVRRGRRFRTVPLRDDAR